LFTTSPADQTSGALAVADDFNPYAAPEISRSADRPLSDPNEGRGVWRDGDVLVMAKIARLPMRCVKCNEPATNRLRRSLYWHNPIYYLLIFVPPGLIGYVVVALATRKTLTFEVPLCDEHRARRRGAILFSWLLGLAGLAICFAPAIDTDYGPAIVVGLIMIIFSLIYGAVRSQIVTPLKIDDTHAWIKKVSPLYLAELPRLPSPYENPNKPRVAYDVEL
jgi:hypothetical protein